MKKILNHCNTLQDTLPCCHADGRACYCYNCLHQGFYAGIDSYSCLKKLCHYVMNYGPIYVSEIYHFLNFSQVITKNFTGKIRVLSLGCGFGPDFMALVKYKRDNKLSFKIKYWGYDKEEKWKTIIMPIFTNIPHIKDILTGFSLKKYDIIFLNKFYSTLKKSNNDEVFLSLFVSEIKKSMKPGTIIVFNDVNHYSMGRDTFDYEVSQVTSVQERYFYNIDSAYTGNYTEIPRKRNICNIPDGLPISPKSTATKSVFFVYKK